MASGVRTFQPKISVVLRKNIGRTLVGAGIPASERFTGGSREIDLTPYLSRTGPVIVQRSVRGDQGMFSLTLADRMEPSQLESLYGVIEPMDMIEIRMARNTADYAGAYTEHMPIMMRGFVGEVTRNQLMTTSGPQRAVTVTGQDYGKILSMMRILYLPAMPDKQNLLTVFKLFLNYGIEAGERDAADFVKDVVGKVVNEGFIARMRAAVEAGGRADARSPIQDIQVDAISGSGTIAPIGSQDWPGGTAFELMSAFCDVGPWNELYVEDRDDGPYLVYRPTPFKNLAGQLIQARGTPPAMVEIKDEDVISLSASRSDSGVANYYWVSAPRYALISAAILQAGALGGIFEPNPYLEDYENSSPSLYGVRTMQLDTQQGPRIDGLQADAYEEKRSIGIDAVNEKRRVLLENNKDNVVLESGGMNLRGNEKIRPGSYLRLTRGAAAGGLTADYYAHTVTHTFVPFESFTTSVQFDRGTGFVERVQRGSGAAGPYLSEMNVRGAYDQAG